MSLQVMALSGHYKIEIDEGVEPIKLPKQRIPVTMMAPLKEELNNLQERDIIMPVDGSTEWISSLVTQCQTEELHRAQTTEQCFKTESFPSTHN